MTAAVAAGLSAFVDELVRSGVTDAVACPGSRSTPLALALRAHPGIHVRVLIDERSAAYVALGMARTTSRAVILLGTSGTAVMNFAPAIVEASLARAPLVVLTADRPAELRDRGAPQTIDQVHLYGRHAKWYTELPLIDGAPETLAHLRSVAGRAVATAQAGPAGPVHVNGPFREPLIPSGDLAGSGDGAPFAAVIRGERTLDSGALGRIVTRVQAHRQGLIVAGPADDAGLPDALARLARASGFPIVADPLSGLRAGPHDRANVIVRGDQLVRPGPWIDAHRPSLVIRFGAMPTSKPLTELLRTVRPELLVVDGDAGWREAALVAATHVHADAAGTAVALAASLAAQAPGDVDGRQLDDRTWLQQWRTADAAAGAAMDAWLAALDESFEGTPFPALARVLPDGGALWAGNSMPVRDLDGWFPSTGRAIALRSNRGANGIDGVISTALGSAAVNLGPVALVVGDLSFLHDLGAFVAARLHDLSLTIVLVNNDGGGIFSFLPQAVAEAPRVGLPTHYEELFGTPHGIEPGPLVEAFGFAHRLVDGRTLEAALADVVGRTGVHVLELRTDRARNVALHHEVAGIVGAVLAALAVEVSA